ncbi:unnamed protein product, partial [Rotaria sp. Silwood1]
MAAKSEARRKLALVIGIGKYEHCDELKNPENDANDMSSTLESIGFTVEKRLHLKRVDMRHAIIDFEESIKPDDMVLFYFAGHGIQWEDQNYLIPSDTPTLSGADLNTSAINAQDILKNLSDRKPYVTIFLLDCCRNYHLRNPRVYARGTDSNNQKAVGNESWVYHKQIDRKSSNAAWVARGDPVPTVVRRSSFASRTLLSIFFGSTGPVLIHSVKRGPTID